MKNSFTRLCLVVCCSALVLAGTAQIKKYPSTLLWRITGKGLSKPSYLFGTMHVTDRRVFYFSDSLYSCLEKADGYAMELDPDSAFTALFRSIFAEDTSGLVKDAVNKKEFSRMAKRLEAELGVPANKVTKKQLWLYSFKGGRDKKEDDMDSPVDTYLYNIAKRQGKWVGGIEDLEDQMSLLEELGSKFDADALLYKANDKAGIEKITGIYKEQDLNGIAAWSEGGDSLFRYNLLYRRNIKMAHRMDSMAAIRSNFFAVGAAHLPGKAGIISLLQAKGYTVEPVISNKKMAPEAYTYKTVDIPWKTIDDDDHTYTMQMPGKPFPMKLPDGLVMNCYADIGTGLLYFSMGLRYPTPVGNTDSVLASVGKNMARSSSVEKQEYINYNGARGVEILAGNANGYYYRVRTFLKNQTLYMVMTGAEKKSLLTNAENERFFSSLVMHENGHPATAPGGEWVKFSQPGKGFSLELPGIPERNNQMEQLFRKSPLAYGWNLDCYAYADNASGNYYLLSIKDTRNGYNLQNDTSIFNDVLENARSKGADIIYSNRFTYEGYAAAKMKAAYTQTNLEMLSFSVCRGNRIYVIMGMYEKGKGDTVAIGRCMQSLRMLNDAPMKWQLQSSADHSFASWAPEAINRVHTKNEDTGAVIFSAYDSLSAISYEVEKQALPPHYWTNSDSSFFAHLLITRYKLWNDSLMKQRETLNGNVKGMEYTLTRNAGNNLKRLRLIPAGDSVYVLFSFIPRQLAQDENVNRFYDSFRLVHEITAKPWLVNKAKQILEGLHAADSATAATARRALNNAPFTHDDLPLLHQALLYPYAEDESNNYLLYNPIRTAIANQKDSTTLSFIAVQYPLLSGEKEKLKYHLLCILAKIQTTPSYTLLQKLLLQNAPKTGNPNILKYLLTDSLSLTASLFPGLLPMSRDTLFIKIMPYLLMNLADSNLLVPALLAPYNKDYYAFARKELRRLKTDEWDYASQPLIHLLGWLNNPESNVLLQAFLQVKSMDLRAEAALALIKNNRPVAPAVLEKIAADKNLRVYLYTELVKYKKEKLYPAIYRTQKSFSESELYRAAVDNGYDSISIRFIEMRKAMYMGKMRIFYLFDLTYNNEDGEQVGHLSVAGPYTASGKLVTESDITQIVSDEEYAPHRITTQFKKVIEEAEQNNKEAKQLLESIKSRPAGTAVQGK